MTPRPSHQSASRCAASGNGPAVVLWLLAIALGEYLFICLGFVHAGPV